MNSLPQNEKKITQHAPTSAPVLSTWQVAPESPAIASFFAPVLSETQKSAIQWVEAGATIATARYGTKEYHAQIIARISGDYHDPEFPFKENSVVEKTAGRCNIGIQLGRIRRQSSTREYIFLMESDTPQGVKEIERLLSHNGIPLFGDRTPRGLHAYFRSPRQLDNFKDDYFGIEIKGVDYCAMVSPSVIADDNGQVIARYIPDRQTHEPPYVVPENDLVFRYPDGTAMEWRYVNSGKRSQSNGLTNRTNRYIKEGHTYRDGRKRELHPSMLEMWDKGYTEPQLISILKPVADANGTSEKYFYSTLKNIAKTAPKDLKNARRINMLECVQHYLKIAPLTATDRKVLLALAKRYMQDNREGTFSASYRNIQTLSSEFGASISSLATIDASITRLIALKLIQHVGTNERSKSNLYRFGDRVHELYTTQSVSSDESSVQSMYPKSDAFQRGALGDIGKQIWETLLATVNPLPFAEIVKRTGLKARTVKKYLNKNEWLQQAGLAEKVAGGWIGHYKSPATLDAEIAVPAGTFGKAATIQTKNEVQRAQRMNHLFIVARFHDAKFLDEFKADLRLYAEYRKLANYPTPTRRNRKPKTEQAQTVENSTSVDCEPLVHNSPIGEIPADLSKSNVVLPESETLPKSVEVSQSAEVAQELSSLVPPPMEAQSDLETVVSPIGDNPPPAAPTVNYIQSHDFVNVTAREMAAFKEREALRLAKSNLQMEAARPSDLSLHEDKPQAVSPTELIPHPSIAQLNEALTNRRGLLAQKKVFKNLDEMKAVARQHKAWIDAGDVTAIQQYLADTAMYKKATRK